MRHTLQLAAVLTALVLPACGGEEAPPPPPAQTAPGGAAAPQQKRQGPGGCQKVEAPPVRESESRERPKDRLEDGTTYSATVSTNCGDFTFELDTDAAPEASASFVALAQDGYFEKTVFHRIVPGFVIQGGDPTATGEGGPGYKTTDSPPEDATYPVGTVAMAKAANEDPGTAGSQFFVVTGGDVGLPAEYAVLGKVTEGAEVVQRIGALGDSSEQPTQPVVIERVEIEES